jgi:hypothetical protein
MNACHSSNIHRNPQHTMNENNSDSGSLRGSGHPPRERESLVVLEGDQGSKAVVTVHDLNAFVGKDGDHRAGQSAIGPDEGCTCPKPILRVTDICRWCVETKGAAVDDPPDSTNGLWMKYRFLKAKRNQTPIDVRPKGEPTMCKETSPCGSDN